jgi:hypothetical protein
MRRKNNAPNRIAIAWLAMLFFVAGCSSNMEPKPLLPDQTGEHLLPKAHVWQCIHSPENEYENYATYSYVLVGRNENNQSSALRYRKLIDAIIRSTDKAADTEALLPTEQCNIFIIPAVECDSTKTLQPKYDVSLRLLSAISFASGRQFGNPGPYIMTLYKPIGKGKPDAIADVLYLDMSTIHPSAMPEFVKTYKNHLTKQEIDGMQSLRSLRLTLLNLGLTAEESIGFAQTAYASLRDAFTEKPAPKQ